MIIRVSLALVYGNYFVHYYELSEKGVPQSDAQRLLMTGDKDKAQGLYISLTSRIIASKWFKARAYANSPMYTTSSFIDFEPTEIDWITLKPKENQ